MPLQKANGVTSPAKSRSFVSRVAVTSAFTASLAALLAAIVTSAVALWLLRDAQDQRLQQAADVLAAEISEGLPTPALINEVMAEVVTETNRTGIVFAVFDAQRQWLAGDHRLHVALDAACKSYPTKLRACQTTSSNQLIAVAASVNTTPVSAFAIAALLAVMLAAIVAWLVSRPLSRAIVAPLARLRSSVGLVPVDGSERPMLGPDEGIQEVDQLRASIEHLLVRVQFAIEQAKRFAANAAHELRTPLTFVRAELELLAEDHSLPTPAKANIDSVAQQVADLGVLVDRLLVLATPKATSNEKSEMVSLRDLVEDAVAHLREDQLLASNPSEVDALLRGDSVLLTAMLGNAVSNALKFGDRVRVQLTIVDGSAIIQIIDDGTGIPASDRERVFEPFFRATMLDRKPVKGHGLGLALIRHVAELHGGTAAFVDAHQPRTTLEIQLPLS